MRRPDLTDLERALVDHATSSASCVETSATRYEQRIVENLRAIIERERILGELMDSSVSDDELCRRLIAGEVDEKDSALMLHLRRSAQLRLQIDNPRYWSLRPRYEER